MRITERGTYGIPQFCPVIRSAISNWTVYMWTLIRNQRENKVEQYTRNFTHCSDFSSHSEGSKTTMQLAKCQRVLSAKTSNKVYVSANQRNARISLHTEIKLNLSIKRHLWNGQFAYSEDQNWSLRNTDIHPCRFFVLSSLLLTL